MLHYIIGHSGKIAELATTLGFGAAVIALLLNVKELRASNKARKQDMYVNLELASIELFKLAIEKPGLEKLYDRQLDKSLSDDNKRAMKEYAASLLNLFEIHYRLRASRGIEPEVFDTWIPWLYELCSSQYFRDIWKSNLRKHYVPGFRGLMDSLIDVFDLQNESHREKMFYARARRFLEVSKCMAVWKFINKG